MATATTKTMRERFRYDWRKWSDGRFWCLELGKDFASAFSVRAAAHRWARDNGMRAATGTAMVKPGNVWVQFTKAKG